MKIQTKQEMYEAQMSYKLGNCLRIWQGIDQVRRSSYDGPIAIRSLVPGHRMLTHIDEKDLETITHEYLKKECLQQEQIIYSEMAAPSMGIKRLLNAEVMRTEVGLYVQWCDENIRMPEAMKKAKVSTGTTAKLVLEHFLDPCDYDDITTLLDMYPDSVIELSVLDKNVGWAGRKMLVWEVKNY